MTPDECKNLDELIATLVKYHPEANVELVEKAYHFAEKAHAGQLRKSGEPYFVHPLTVAGILAKLMLDAPTIAAGLLHDTVEDCEDVTLEVIEKEFGQEVALLVDGVTKLRRLDFTSRVEQQAESIRKMILAMSKDIRVVLIKLADRTHNMRTLKSQPPESQKRIAQETLDIYAPLAHRLGVYKIKQELEDLCLRYLDPEGYQNLIVKVGMKRAEREENIRTVIDMLSDKLKEMNIHYEIDGRPKHFYSIYRKMVLQHKPFEQIFDLIAIRVLVDTVQDCYAVLGVVHTLWKQVPNRFKDYISMPKPNMYQSLHTTVVGENGMPFEVQIRTYEMHRIAEYGIAAHWRYKEGKQVADSLDNKLYWLRQILDWQNDTRDSEEFIKSLKVDLFSDEIFVFTPKGEIIDLPKGATPIDFAYAIHSAVGNKMIGAKVNGKLVTIDYVIQNGDRIEIITSQNSHGPSRDWLNIVKSTQAKNKINQWFKKEFKEENIVEGRNKILQYCKGKSVDLATINKPEYLQKACVKYGFTNWDAVLAAIGHGSLKESQVVSKLIEEKEKHTRTHVSDADIINNIEDKHVNVTPVGNGHKSTILINKLGSIDVHLSKCCHPVPGDEIIGYVTKGRGITIHRTDCTNILHFPESERARLVPAEWSDCKVEGTFAAKISVYAHNRVGLLVDVSKVFTDENIDVKSIDVRTDKKDQAILNFGFDVKNKEQLAKISSKIKNVSGVTEVARVK